MIQCTFSIKSFRKELRKQAVPILDDEKMFDSDKKENILKIISNISESMGISQPNQVNQVLDLTNDMFKGYKQDQLPDNNSITAAITAWRDKSNTPSEDTSSDRLNSMQNERFNDDIFDNAYGTAMNAKIRAKQHANKVGINSLLFTDEGIIQNTIDLNKAIQQQQEKLLQKVIDYLKTRVEDDPLFKQSMYKRGKYTGIVEKIQAKYARILDSKNFDSMTLDRDFNSRNYDKLDAYSSWIILNNFDKVLQDMYGKALAINPDKSKFTGDFDKYAIAGGSNVYTTWRTSEEIDLSKEVNNITQSIIKSLPLILNGTTTPTQQNLKFNEFVYIIGKIKDIPYNAKKDFNLAKHDVLYSLSKSTQDFLKEKNKGILDIINELRDNPQEYLPVIFDLLSNENVRRVLKGQEVIGEDTFLDIDLDLINSLNLGLFDESEGSKSLRAIQNKSGYQGVNYFAFITQTIDSIYKAGFLQYFRDHNGNIYMRNMFDQSINNIQYNLQNIINSINSQTQVQTYSPEKYNISDTKQELKNGQTYTVDYNGQQYDITINNDSITGRNRSDNTIVTEPELLYKLADEYKKQKGYPATVTYEVKGFRGKTLVATTDILTGDTTYTVDGKQISGFNESDYQYLKDIIQDVLKQNFDLDQTYFQAFCKNNISNGTTQLMQLVSRVITNQYISNQYLNKDKHNPNEIKHKLKQIFTTESSTNPTFNKDLGEINLLTEKDSGILSIMAQAKALVTGRLTSSQILDGEGNALASSSLSRGMATMPYQVLKQIKEQENAAAKDFTLWNQGVYLGIQQLKEVQDRQNDTSKTLTAFSPKEFAESAIMIDFLQAIVTSESDSSRTQTNKNGIAAFLPSENSDKSYIGRMLIDLKKIDINGQSLYDLLKTGRRINRELFPIIIKELGSFYNKAMENINSDWGRVGTQLGKFITEYNENLRSLNIEDPNAYLPTSSKLEYGKWDNLNIIAEKLGKTPMKLLGEIITKHNYENPNNIITLTDEVHYVSTKEGYLDVNESLLANVARFNNPESFSRFIAENEADLLQTLLEHKVSLDVTDDYKKLAFDGDKVKPEFARWIDKATNKLILAYEIEYDPFTGHAYSKAIRRYQDIEGDFEVNSVHEFELNPLISNYNLLNYFLTQEFMNSSVGAFYAHPSKAKGERYDANGIVTEAFIREDEKTRKAAQDKRNVSFTAAMHSFQKNLLQGIPEEINIAIMPDNVDIFQTISGNIEEINAFDGATFGNPFFTILENYSLGGAKVGITKKTFTHYYDHRTGTGGIIKTAEFPLTNNTIRNFPFYQVMMKNMTDRIWRNQDGSEAIVDITRDYNGKPIMFTNPTDQKGQCYFLGEDGNYYAILSIKSDGNNLYTRTIQQVDDIGRAMATPTDEQFEVNTNYKLWKLLGGEKAVEMKIGDNKFTLTEHSINHVVNVMNNTTGNKIQINGKYYNVLSTELTIGNKIKRVLQELDKNGNVVQRLDENGNPTDRFEQTFESPRYQSDIWQPLKHADIHLMPTVGAVKQGAANINTDDTYRVGDSSKINFMKIKLNQSGVQLDKEHHADGDELSIMTQVLSACAARGYTQAESQEMYNALASLARAGIRDHIDAFNEFFQNPTEENKDNYQKVILDTLIDAFAHNSDSSQMLQMVTRELLNKAKEGKEIAFKDLNTIPYSDPSVFRRLHSTISVALTRAAIKIKVDGILSVLQPSYNIVKLYGDRLHGSFKTDKEIQDLQAKRDDDPQFELLNNISQIRIGRTYRITHPDESVNYATIKTHSEYYKLKEQLRNYPESITSIREQIAPAYDKEGKLLFEGGRELAAYNATFAGRIIPKQAQIVVTGSPSTTAQVAQQIGGIDVLRHPDANGMHFGNPFTHLPNEVQRGRASVLTNNVAEAVEAFRQWLNGEAYQDVEPVRRQWIIDQINDGVLDGQTLVYYTDKVKDTDGTTKQYHPEKYPNHAHILQQFINNRQRNEIPQWTGLIPEEIRQQIDSVRGWEQKLQKAQQLGLNIDNNTTPRNVYEFVSQNFPILSRQSVSKETGFKPADLTKFSTILRTEENGGISIERAAEQIYGQLPDYLAEQTNSQEIRNIILDILTSAISVSDIKKSIYKNRIEEALETYEGEYNQYLDAVNEYQKTDKLGHYNIYDLASVKELARLQESKAPKSEIKAASAKMQEDLMKLHKRKGTLVLEDGNTIELDASSVNIEPYEIVMPKVFKDIFGLDTYDDLNEIKNNPDFFTNRLLEKCNPKVGADQYSLALLRLNGKHTYLLHADQAVEIPGEFYRKTDIHQFQDKGKLWKVDGNGNKQFQMNKDDEIWVKIVNGKEQEVIVTRNLASYIQNQKFNTLSISPSVTNVDSIIRILDNSKKKSVQRFIQAIRSLAREEGTYSRVIHTMYYDDLDSHPLKDYLTELGSQIHNSFLKSLNIVAARIPAQSMQSFMPMKVVAFDAPDINTAYVNTAQFLFEGSDLDIDAVSLAAYAFDSAGRYVMWSPHANLNTKETFEASEQLPFPTGKSLNVGGEESIDYSEFVGRVGENNKPFQVDGANTRLNIGTPSAIKSLAKLVKLCNKLGYIPNHVVNNSAFQSIVKNIADSINEHNLYINDESVEKFSKNFIVTSMFNIGLSPANLIESQQALDSSKAPFKSVAESTKKAKAEQNARGNVGSFMTNVLGIAQNMAGKQGVGISAVGLKGFFAATARYNEALANGTSEEIERLKSKVDIAGEEFKMLANSYVDEGNLNAAILSEILDELDQGTDAALVLSVLLSLSTDNAKDLALDKLNAQNFLGMYIYGIAIGVDFRTLGSIIASDTGLIINELMGSNVFNGDKGLNMQAIFDYIELGPKITTSEKLSEEGGVLLNKYLDQKALWKLAYDTTQPLEQKLQFLENLKIVDKGVDRITDTVFNNLVEKAQEYIRQIHVINNDSVNVIWRDSTQRLLHNTGQGFNEVYKNFKRLNEGGEELRSLGQFLHVNQGLETQYYKAISYLENFSSAIYNRKYSKYRERKREYELKERRLLKRKENGEDVQEQLDELEGNKKQFLKLPPSADKFDVTKFIINKKYREEQIDKYNKNKVFFNILDIMQVPHFFSYLESAVYLDQEMMKTSAKYRAIKTLGNRAIDIIGAFSTEDKENILKRTEQYVDRVIRDRFLVQTGWKIRIPKGQDYFIEENGKIIKKTAKDSHTIIELGTRAGNASFKALMETRIIPDLQEGKIGGNKKSLFIQNNAFIKSLSTTSFRGNPEYSVTVNMAPSINMSPRSDTDKALFEQVKYDFNQFRTSPIKYQIGENLYDIIDLFYLYNQIAFQGKPGENTLTSIFTDVLDYNIIKRHRDFINEFDNNHDLSESIVVEKMLREVATKANPYDTYLNFFYYEDPDSGRLAFWSPIDAESKQFAASEGIRMIDINGHTPAVLPYLMQKDYANYITQSREQDESDVPLTVDLEGNVVQLNISHGNVTEMTLYPKDDHGVIYFGKKQVVKIPLDKQKYFKDLPMKTIITTQGTTMEYDKEEIKDRVNNLLSCGG